MFKGVSRWVGLTAPREIHEEEAMADAPTKKRKYSQNKRELDKARSKTRVNLGLAFPRWRALKERMGLKSDAELGIFLLDR